MSSLHVQVPGASGLLLIICMWVYILRQLDLRSSKKALEPDCELYEAEYERLMDKPQVGDTIRHLEDFSVRDTIS